MKYLTPFLFAFLLACQPSKPETAKASNAKYDPRIEPVLITDKLPHDTDDPALWIDPTEVSKSTVLGMDKEKNGGVYAFDLEGKIIHHKTISPVERPNNIDVEYGIVLGKDTIDIAVFTESFTEKLRVISMPDMSYVDGGGTHAFVGETRPEARIPMGIGLYKDTASAKVYAMVSRRSGPTDGTYLWQYELVAQDSTLTGELVRKFGAYSGSGGIEAVAVDDELGYVYYSDETSGIRKYYAHPDSSDRELAHFGTEDFLEEREGIAIWPTEYGRGYILVSDQQQFTFEVFTREGSDSDPHKHQRLGEIRLSTLETDGCDLYADSISPRYPEGIFVAMSEGAVFHYYDLRDIRSAISRL